MKKIVSLFIITAIMTTGCNNKINNNSDEISKINDKLNHIEQVIADINEKIDNNISNNTELEVFKVYGFDKTYTYEQVDYISIPTKYSKKEKINTLFNKLKENDSRDLNLDINLREDNILVLDIVNGGEYNSQISTTTAIDDFILHYIKSLLQPDYNGEWIDGVQVLSGGIVRKGLGEGAFEHPFMRDEF